jgi:hypothetical protein
MLPVRLLASLVLASSLVLVLPRGWCCIFAALGAKPNTPKRCCCSLEVPDETPAPSGPRPVKRCPCADRDTVLPHHDDAPAPDVLPSPARVGPAAAPLPAPPAAVPSRFERGPPPPLLLLKCSWLC